MIHYMNASSVSVIRVWILLLAFFVVGQPFSLAQSTFDPNNPPESASAPWDELYYEYSVGGYQHQKGPKTVLVFLVEPSDGPDWNDPPAFSNLESQLANATQHYYRASYRQTWFGPKRIPGSGNNYVDVPRLVVTPVMRLPKTEAEYKNSFGTLQSDCLAAARSLGGEWNGGDLDPSNFDRWVVMSNTKMISSTGLAYVGGKFAWVGLSLDSNAALHEWGHNWGVYHANAWVVPEGSDPNLRPRSPSRQNAEYQDGYDIMGGGSSAVMFGPQFLENLGFLERNRAEALEITESDTYRLYAYMHSDRRRTENNTRALVIPMSSFFDNKRVIIGFPYRDSGVDGGPSRVDWSRNALTLHSKLSNGSNLLDTTPNSQPNGDERVDSALKIGRTYSEGPEVNGTQMYDGFHVTPVVRGSSVVNGIEHQWMDVVVNYEKDISGNQAPSASFAETLITGAVPGEPFTFSVTAFDSDGDALAYDWDFGDGGYSIVNAVTQTHTWSASGMYLVTCTVSDMKGGVATAQAWVNVGNVAFRAAESPANTLAGLRYQYYERSLNALPDFRTLLPVKSGTVDTFSIAPKEINDTFAFVYNGFIEVPEDDVYTFYLNSDDGSRLYIGDTLVVDNDGLKSGAEEASGNIALDAGKHPVRVEMFHRDGTEALTVSWSTLDTGKAEITFEMLSHVDPAQQSFPTADLTAPGEGAEFLVNSDITLEGTASSGEGIEAVRFFANGAYLGLDETAPYEFTWEKVSVGTYELVVVATDINGLSTAGDPVNIEVISPPPARGIAVNVGAAGADTTVGAGDSAGAVYAVSNWNNPGAETVTAMALQDVSGLATTARLTYDANGTQSGLTQSNGQTDGGNGRLLRGNLRLGEWIARDLALEFTDIPYEAFDVYVYFDPPNTTSHDTFVHEFVLTPGGQSPRPSIFAKNSQVNGDALGDWPGYDTWTGFREATAVTHTAPEAELLGNYVVFREVTSSDFVVASVVPPGRDRSYRYISAVQIVETSAPEPRAPTITQQPESLSVTVGQAVSFTVAYDALPAPDIQWYQDGVPVPGGIGDTLAFASVDASNAGIYTVTLVNDVDSATSAPATLTVLEPSDAIVLIDNSNRNGSFEDPAGASSPATTSDPWAHGINSAAFQRYNNGNAIPDGTWSLAVGRDGDQNILGAWQNTGFTVQTGDVFTLSFNWAGAYQWESTARIQWRLFTTDDDTSTGAATDIASGFVDGKDAKAVTSLEWSSAPVLEAGGDVGSASEGRELFIEFYGANLSGTAGRFARLDAVELSVLRQTQADTYTVGYSGNGHTGGTVPSDPGEYEEGASVTAAGAGDLEKTHYLFAGWNTAADGSGTGYDAGGSFAMPGAGLTLYAVWDILPPELEALDVTASGAGLTFAGDSGLEYLLEVRESLTVGDWLPIGDWKVAVEGQVTLEDPAPTANARFYRVRVRRRP